MNPASTTVTLLQTTLVFLLLSLNGALAAEATAPSEPHLSQVRQLSFLGTRAGEGYFSADGKQLVFQSERDKKNPYYQIYLWDLVKNKTQKISSGVGKTTCSWIHPDNSRVLYSSTQDDPQVLKKQKKDLELKLSGQQKRYGWDYDETYEIYQKDLKTGKTLRLTRMEGYDAEASYSPDGKKIIFASNFEAYQRKKAKKLSADELKRLEMDPSYFIDLYTMDADGSNIKALTTHEGYDGGPFYSANGEWITWRRFTPDGKSAEVWVARADGSEARAITDLKAMSWAPYFHPSGDYLIFTTNLQGHANFELYIVDFLGTQTPVRVTFTDGFDGLPVFTPDGNYLAWSTTRTPNKQSQLFVAKWNDVLARKSLGLNPAVEVKTSALAQNSPFEVKPVPSSENIARVIKSLASPEMEGRLAGSLGEQKAAQAIAAEFKAIGLKVVAPSKSYLHAFPFTAGVSVGKNSSLNLEEGQKTTSLKVQQDWMPVAISTTGKFKAKDYVFAGYGIEAPAEFENKKGQSAYSSYEGLEVKDRWVVVLRFLPEDVSPERRQYLYRYASLRHKAMVAREKGAKGLIVVTGPQAQVKSELVPLKFDAAVSASGIPVVSVTNDLGQMILKSVEPDFDLEATQKKLDTGEPLMAKNPMAKKAEPGASLVLDLEIDIVHVKKEGQNVLGWLKSKNAQPGAPVIVVGAHLDHLGFGDVSTSRARDNEQGQIHFGADDNASGVAAMLEMARALKKAKDLKRDILFAAWSGEELGVLGSRHFVDHSAVKVGAYLNLDMVGRLRSHLSLQGVDSSAQWNEWVESVSLKNGLSIVQSGDPYVPTDALSFYVKKVPVLFAFTGSHDEYHTPRDKFETINLEGTAQVAKWMTDATLALAQAPELPKYQEVSRKAGEPRSSKERSFRVYLGTLPDYTSSETNGLKITGTRKDSPAERAGIKAEDILVELAGRKITNIYDYTYLLEALRPGTEVSAKIKRGGDLVELKITPVPKD